MTLAYANPAQFALKFLQTLAGMFSKTGWRPHQVLKPSTNGKKHYDLAISISITAESNPLYSLPTQVTLHNRTSFGRPVTVSSQDWSRPRGLTTAVVALGGLRCTLSMIHITDKAC